MHEFEADLWGKGYRFVGGVDEVGRGCLYGDVVAACVIFPAGTLLPGVKDSKACTARQRERLYEEILQSALAVGIGAVDVETIERMNIRQSSRMAMLQAVQALHTAPDYLLIDAEEIEADIPQQKIVHGDARCHVIAAASIVAKVTRDRMCQSWEELDPGYGIARHKGYATAEHREKIRQLGVTPRHRRSFLSNVLSST